MKELVFVADQVYGCRMLLWCRGSHRGNIAYFRGLPPAGRENRARKDAYRSISHMGTKNTLIIERWLPNKTPFSTEV